MQVISDVNTDKARYVPGDRVTIYVDLTNTTGSTITNGNVTLYCKYLGTLVDTLPAQTLRARHEISYTTECRPDLLNEAAYRSGCKGYFVPGSNPRVRRLQDAHVHLDPARYGLQGLLGRSVDARPGGGDPGQQPQHGGGRLLELDEVSPLRIPVGLSVAVERDVDEHGLAAQELSHQRFAILRLAVQAPPPPRGHGRQPGCVLDRSRQPYDLPADGPGHDQRRTRLRYVRHELQPDLWRMERLHQRRRRLPVGAMVDHERHEPIHPAPAGLGFDIYLFNPADAGWQNYIFSREADVFAAYPFDGWHVDSVGNPPAPVYTYTGDPVDVWTTFRPFLNNAKARLNRVIVFNNVGGYGLFDTAANTTNDVVYVECWPATGQVTYNDLKTLIDQCVEWSGDKGVVLPAYMNYEYAKRFSGDKPGSFNQRSVLLANAAIFASGATHLELGDGGYMLCSEYFPNHNLVPSTALKAALRNYYDFLVAYQNLLQGRFKNSPNLLWLSVPNSNDASPERVWAFTKVSGDDTQHMINLINLQGVHSNAWRDDNGDYPAPVPQSDIVVKYYYGAGTVTSVRWASPDFQNGKMNDLPRTFGADGDGRYVQFTVPSLAYWDMIYITK